jgi:hypothetical protein
VSEQEFESYLRLLGRFLKLNTSQREAIREELRDHLEARLDDLVATGMDREQAVIEALDEFGDAASLAHAFDRIGRRRKWIMRSTVGALALTCTILIVSALLPAGSVSPTGPAWSMAGDSTPGAESAMAVTEEPTGVAPRPPERDPNEVTRQKLRERIAAVEFEFAPLGDVIDYLRAQSGVSIDANWRALEVLGIEPANEVTLNVRDVAIETALQLVLENVGGPDAELAYYLLDGMVRITTVDELASHTEIRVYDVHDLVGIRTISAMELDEMTERALDMGMAQFRAQEADKLSSGELDRASDLVRRCLAEAFQDEVRGLMRQQVHMVPEATAQLTELIRMNVEPGTWTPEGSVGSIGAFDGMLVVRHTTKVHESIERLLMMLRETRAARGEDYWVPVAPADAMHRTMTPYGEMMPGGMGGRGGFGGGARTGVGGGFGGAPGTRGGGGLGGMPGDAPASRAAR